MVWVDIWMNYFEDGDTFTTNSFYEEAKIVFNWFDKIYYYTLDEDFEIFVQYSHFSHSDNGIVF